jgi:ATP-binding cassette subfamily B protein/subfamily B ATP-binding cassette protein MsbA
MERRLDVTLDKYLDHRSKIIAREEIAGPVSEFVGALIFAGISIYIADQIIGGQASIGTFLSFIAAVGQFSPPVKKLQDAYIRLQPTVAATQRLFAILEDESEVPQSKSLAPFPEKFSDIRFENVSFAYKKGSKASTLSNINLTVRRGEIVALVGESGSGKSTLVNLLERFFDPTVGRISVGGIPIDEIDLKELRRNIALVTQDVFLFNESIERNIRAGDLGRAGGSVEECARSANALEFIQNTESGFQTSAGDRGARLSGGERQRISIARALYKDAPILILDEATSALDSASEVEVQKGLDRLMRDRTVFVIAHRLSTVVNADRILVLKDGKIVEQGRHDELLDRRGPYYNFYQLQAMR